MACKNCTCEPKSQVGYENLLGVFQAAFAQASLGKGRDRHGTNTSLSFNDQPGLAITRQLGLGFPLGQAMKKIIESQSRPMAREAMKAELYDAMVYLAIAALFIDELAGDNND